MDVNQTAPFSISRVLKAPRALVFKVQTDPAHLEQWFSPAGFKTIHAELDFKVGGTYHYGLEGPGGMRMWGLQKFLEIVPDERIVLIQSFSNEHRALTRHPMAPDWPLEMLATTTFQDAGAGKTLLTISWRPHNSDEAGRMAFENGRAGMQGGFSGTLAKLEAYLESLQNQV
jgi:uncharacterized protein YndB with AHSA1/START domain